MNCCRITGLRQPANPVLIHPNIRQASPHPPEGFIGRIRKITAVCHLHLSRALLAQGKLSQATGHFSQWELLQPELDNAFLTDLGNKVAQQLMPVKEDFRIPHAAPDLNAKTHEHRLHGWLARNALLRADWDYKQAGRLLGDKNKPYNAATVRLWEEQGGPGDSKAQGA